MGLCRARGPLRARTLDHTAESAGGVCVGEVAKARDLEKARGSVSWQKSYTSGFFLVGNKQFALLVVGANTGM